MIDTMGSERRHVQAWRLVRRAYDMPAGGNLAEQRDSLLRRAAELVGRDEMRRLWRKLSDEEL